MATSPYARYLRRSRVDPATSFPSLPLPWRCRPAWGRAAGWPWRQRKLGRASFRNSAPASPNNLVHLVASHRRTAVRPPRSRVRNTTQTTLTHAFNLLAPISTSPLTGSFAFSFVQCNALRRSAISVESMAQPPVCQARNLGSLLAPTPPDRSKPCGIRPCGRSGTPPVTVDPQPLTTASAGPRPSPGRRPSRRASAGCPGRTCPARSRQ